MNYGRFFEFDFESSYLQKGIAVFNYRWLKRQDGSDKNTPRYPVYLTFTPESFSFNLHYLKEKKDKEGEKSQGMELSHYHNTIIEVRLAPNVDEAKGLTESLNNAYDAQFPLKTKDNGGGITTVDDDLLEVVKNSFDAQDCLVGGYSQLDCFEPEAKVDYDLTQKSTPHLLRKIILDFLFDLEFSNVFKNIAFYDDLAAKLKEDFFFNALLNKARYYYYRTELNAKEAVERCLQKGEDVAKCDQGLKFFFEQYAKAERAWVSSIVDSRAMKTFHESPWFDEAYQELEQVYFASRAGRWRKKSEGNAVKDIPQEPRIGSVPPARKAARKAAARRSYLKRIGATEDPFKLTVSNMLNLTRKQSPELWKTKEKTSFNGSVRMHCDTAKKAASWEVSHYHFIGLWKLWFGDIPTLVSSMAIIVPLLLILLLWVCGVYLDDEGFDFLSEASNKTIKNWFFIITIVPVAIFIYAIGWVIRRHFRSTWGEGSMALMMPRLLAAVTTAWFTMTMSVDVLQVFVGKLEHLRVPAMIILASMTLFFEVYEARMKNPFDQRYQWLLSSVTVFAIAFTYSIIVGLMAFHFFGYETVEVFKRDEPVDHRLIQKGVIKLEYISYYYKQIHPYKFVFQFSFFATFIGIFLQLMFQGKSASDTE